ncbi:hypothetical protein EVAR_559_1 [Eumeta japonica]|uniref:Uncharacterized protein n=1 Tax=Eumeta variegata TaxID=151549 RepID=A0A4C1SD38_EUMVA|nr:hypothetical protein EVAR_559_1 [Eumeta japonica]
MNQRDSRASGRGRRTQIFTVYADTAAAIVFILRNRYLRSYGAAVPGGLRARIVHGGRASRCRACLGSYYYYYTISSRKSSIARRSPTLSRSSTLNVYMNSIESGQEPGYVIALAPCNPLSRSKLLSTMYRHSRY